MKYIPPCELCSHGPRSFCPSSPLYSDETAVESRGHTEVNSKPAPPAVFVYVSPWEVGTE